MIKRLSGFLAVVFLVFTWSCSTEGDIRKILGTHAEPPVFLDCRPVSSTEIAFKFSQPVRVVSLSFDSALETGSIEEGQELRIHLKEPLEAGKKYTVDILVEDSDRNSLNVIVPFRARNDRMPALVFNELRTEYSKPRAEFVEFLVMEAGNLGAMRLYIAGQSLSKPVYEFPPAEVNKGEYMVLHLRTIDEGCLDETGSDLALSSGTGSDTNARDFWVPGAAKLLRKTDALWLVDQDDRIIDAVLLSEKPDANWNNRDIAAAAEFFGSERAWLPPKGEGRDIIPEHWVPGPTDAVITGGTTVTRTICRDESLAHENRGGNWYITATSSATPGKPNSVKRFN